MAELNRNLPLETLLEAAALRTREVSGSEPFSLECSCWCWLTAIRMKNTQSVFVDKISKRKLTLRDYL